MTQYFHFKGLTSTNIEAELDTTLGDCAPSFTTIKYWVVEFKRRRTSSEYEHLSGRPYEVTTPEMMNKIYKIVVDDHRLKVRDLADLMSTTITQNRTKTAWMFQSSV